MKIGVYLHIYRYIYRELSYNIICFIYIYIYIFIYLDKDDDILRNYKYLLTKKRLMDRYLFPGCKKKKRNPSTSHRVDIQEH